MKGFYTSKEQSRTLESLGLKWETCDLVYPEKACGGYYDIPSQKESIDTDNPSWSIPCWSAGALMEVLPEKVKAVNMKHDYEWEFTFEKMKDRYLLCYSNPVLDFYEDGNPFHTEGGLMDVLFEAVKFLLENKLI